MMHAVPTKPPVPAGPMDASSDANNERDVQDAKIAALEAQIAELRKMVQAGAPRSLESVQSLELNREREREKWYEEQARYIGKGNVVITQELCDKRYPSGRHTFECILDDGNMHPKIRVKADNEVDAAARYMSVCGINSAEKRVDAVQVA
jgi:hypothetical protein